MRAGRRMRLWMRIGRKSIMSMLSIMSMMLLMCIMRTISIMIT